MHDAGAHSSNGYIYTECRPSKAPNSTHIAFLASKERYTALQGPRVGAQQTVTVQLNYHITGSTRLLIGIEASDRRKTQMNTVVSKSHTEDFTHVCQEIVAPSDSVILIWTVTLNDGWYSLVSVDDIVLLTTYGRQQDDKSTQLHHATPMTAQPTSANNQTDTTSSTFKTTTRDAAETHDDVKSSGLGAAAAAGISITVCLITAALIGVAFVGRKLYLRGRRVFSIRRRAEDKQVIIDNPVYDREIQQIEAQEPTIAV